MSPEKQRRERLDRNAEHLVRYKSPDSSMPGNFAGEADPPCDSQSIVTPDPHLVNTALVIPFVSQAGPSAQSRLRESTLETRASMAHEVLVKRIEKTSKKIELQFNQLQCNRFRGIQEQKMEFFSAVDELARLQEQNINLWKARYSRGERVRAAQLLQGWWRLKHKANIQNEPELAKNPTVLVEVCSAAKLQNWWRGIVAHRNYNHFVCVASLLPERTKHVMRSKIQGPNLWGSLTRSRMKSQQG